MNKPFSQRQVAKFFANTASFILAAGIILSLFPVGAVSAYVTKGANGRSLGLAPGFYIERNLMAPAGTLCRSGQLLTNFSGVTIHETSNWSPNADARMHAQYLRGSGANSEVSWHYCVDNVSAYQSIPEYEKAWHAGDKANGKGNGSTIAIEICDNSNGDFDQAMANAEWLAADILYRHGVYTVSGTLFQHHDFSSYAKNCPITIRDTGRWNEFTTKTQSFLDAMVAEKGAFTPILMTATATADQAKNWAASNHASTVFIMLADLYYDLAPRSGVNPVMAYAQAAHETAFGNFGGVIDASFRNPCGMKTTVGGSNSDPNAHQRFPSWQQGVQAHIDHLALYAGQIGYPKSYPSSTPDPRHFSSLFATCRSVEGLSGKWAPGADYGGSVIKKMNQIQSASKDPYKLDALVTGINVLSYKDGIMYLAITAQNIGSVSWTEEIMTRMAFGLDTADQRAYIPSGIEVPSGQSYTFEVSLKIPDTQPHRIVTRMVQDGVTWLGTEVSQEVALRAAQIESIKAPAAILSGDNANVEVVVENTGLVPWTAKDMYRLATQCQDLPGNRSYLDSKALIKPGDTYTFTFATNTKNDGPAITIDLQMVQDGVTFFGQKQTLVIPVKSNEKAEISSVVLPDTIKSGETFTAEITVKNTDAVSWSEKDKIRLGVLGNMIGKNRVRIPAGEVIDPGESYTFTYTATAPQSGDLIFITQMVREGVNWFGDKKTTLRAYDDAAVTSVEAPESMPAGAPYSFMVTIKNTGLSTWTTSTLYRLSANNSDTTASRFYMAPKTTVAPGESYTFTVTAKAMLYPSSANLKLQMVREGVKFFGEVKNVSIPTSPEHDALIESIEFVTPTKAGESFTASIRVQNKGSSTWTSATKFRLGVMGNMTGPARANLPSGVTVKPGESFDFLYTAKAPSTGDLSLKVQMLQENVLWFGEKKEAVVPQYNAEIISTTKPESVVAGRTTNFTVTVKNTGTMTWKASDLYRLATNASDTVSNRSYMDPNVSVASGETYTFTVTVKAMLFPNDAKVNLQMVRDAVAFFGQKTELTIPVVSERQSEIESISFSVLPKAGQSFTMQVTVKNTGSVIWSESSLIRLGVEGNYTGTNRVCLPPNRKIKPDETYSFTFVAVAPASGTLSMDVQMVQDGITWFGEKESVSQELTE